MSFSRKQLAAAIRRLEAAGVPQSAEAHQALTEAPGGRSKYGNVRCELDGHTFDSGAEMRRYGELRLLEQAGLIANLQLQPRFDLLAKAPGQKGTVYIADFSYQEDGRTVVEDTKGGEATQTAVFKLKAKLFKARYPEHELRIITGET